MSLWLRSLVFNTLFVLWSFFCMVVLLWTMVVPRPFMIKMITYYFRSLSWLERNIVGITYEVQGRENLISGPSIIAMKHQSAWETFKLFVLFGDVSIILKRELMFIPLWGWYQWKSGAIAIDRSSGKAALKKMLDGAGQAFANGQRLVIYPQGTRVPPGEKRPYKPGVGFIYAAHNVPMVPVTHNAGSFWGKNSFIKRPGHIVVRILPAIPAGLKREEAMQQLEAVLEAA
jgi:1-acyl-sn-glycerol-3-phosphate acyltransferase